MENNITIREAALHDLNGLMQLYTHLHGNPIPEQNDALTELWMRILEDKNHHTVIASDGEMLVSSCICTVILNLTHEQRPYALIENVVTHPDYRKQGIATACLSYAKQIAQENNCYKIMLMTGAKDQQTLHFYEQAGYNRNDKTAFIQWL